MSTVRCGLCDRDAVSLFIVTHKERGRIRIFRDCLDKEAKNLLAKKSCC